MSTRRQRANTGPVSPEVSVPDAGRVAREEDWYGRVIEEGTWERWSFLDCDWTEVSTNGVVFDSCEFAGVKFNASRHTAAAFTNCTFRNCVFFDTAFTDCKFVGSRFLRSSFTLLDVIGGDWSFTGLPGADLRRCSFRRVRMRECDLTSARLDEATVTDADLSGALLHGANLTDADLRGSDLSSLDPLTVGLRGAIIGLDQAATVAQALGLRVR